MVCVCIFVCVSLSVCLSVCLFLCIARLKKYECLSLCSVFVSHFFIMIDIEGVWEGTSEMLTIFIPNVGSFWIPRFCLLAQIHGSCFFKWNLMNLSHFYVVSEYVSGLFCTPDACHVIWTKIVVVFKVCSRIDLQIPLAANLITLWHLTFLPQLSTCWVFALEYMCSNFGPSPIWPIMCLVGR